MELILGLFYEKRGDCLEQRSVICAVVLALFLGGVCHGLSVRADDRDSVRAMETAGCAASSVTPGAAAALRPDIERISGGLLKEEEGTAVPEASAKARDMDDGGGVETVNADGSAADEPADPSPAKTKAAYGKAAVAEKKRPAFADRQEKKVLFAADREGAADVPEKTSGALHRITEILGAPGAAAGREISGFVCDDRGYITGYRDSRKFLKDSLAVLPKDSACTGVTKEAFKGLEDEIAEIFVTANIMYIEEGTFDGLVNLVYIEADPQNTAFYSADGILYRRDGRIFARPQRLM